MALTKVGKEGITGISNASNATAITINSSENVDIGGTLAAGATTVRGDLSQNQGDYLYTGGGNFDIKHSTAGQSILLQTTPSGGSTTERVRVTSAGVVSIGSTSTDPIGDAASSVAITASGNIGINKSGAVALDIGRSSSNGAVVGLYRGTSQVGTISVTGSNTAYNTSSDYRLKENVDYTWDATTRLKQLKPARFNFITDADTTVDGFIAHEAQTVVPESVTGTKDAVDEDGVAVMQGIDNSKLVPLLVKTIQELEARLTAGGL